MSGYIKFFYICFCFFISLASLSYSHSKDGAKIISTALFFTVLSDFCLIILEAYEMGVFLFCFVQIFYIAFVNSINVVKYILGYSVIAFLTLYFVFSVPLLISLSFVYANLFLLNLISCIKAYKNNYLIKPNNVIFITGIILFLLCDINVLLYNLKNYAKYNIYVEKLSDFAVLLIWVFYTPSQFLLSITELNLDSFGGKK